VDYKIVTAISISSLENKVITYIKEGWIPVGGICAPVNYSTGYYHQAVYLPIPK
jgi:hypothetical protein